MNGLIEKAIRTNRKHQKADPDVELYPIMVKVMAEMKVRKVTFLPKQVVRKLVKPLARNSKEFQAALSLQGNLGLSNNR